MEAKQFADSTQVGCLDRDVVVTDPGSPKCMTFGTCMHTKPKIENFVVVCVTIYTMTDGSRWKYTKHTDSI